MAGKSPVETVEMLIEAFHNGDVDAGVALYEKDGTIVVEPGVVASGGEGLREAIAGFIAVNARITSKSHKVFESGDLALFCSSWEMVGTAPDGSPIKQEGMSTDVLRRASDGTWLIAIDNPWGTAVLLSNVV